MVLFGFRFLFRDLVLHSWICYMCVCGDHMLCVLHCLSLVLGPFGQDTSAVSQKGGKSKGMQHPLHLAAQPRECPLSFDQVLSMARCLGYTAKKIHNHSAFVLDFTRVFYVHFNEKC